LQVAFLSRGMQLASSGADGLCKLWTLKTNECVGTMDGHTDKVWALTINQAEDRIMSGGGDSVISVWRDVTDEVEEKANAEREEQILLYVAEAYGPVSGS
jgi:U3 small nucleolar RNA-associated protein 13